MIHSRRIIVAVASLLAIAACSGIGADRITSGSGSSSPSRVAFYLDGMSCQGTHLIDYFIDEQLVGSVETTAGGESTMSFPVEPGEHSFRAELPDRSAVWGPATVIVPASARVDVRLTCTFVRSVI